MFAECKTSIKFRVVSGDGVTGDGGYGDVTGDKIFTGDEIITGEAFSPVNTTEDT